MGKTRKLASALLKTALRLSRAEREGWGEAMLRELDFVEGDWDALRWAVGSSTALLRHQGSCWLTRALGPEGESSSARRKALGAVLGVGLAGATLALGVCGLWRRLVVLLPHAEWDAATIAVIAALEVAYFRVAIALWRRRRPVSVGILLAAVALTVHVAIHTQAIR
jgi:hypothetical protein